MLLVEILSNFLQQDLHTFDQTPKGWRSLLRNNPTAHDYIRVAQLIDQYIATNTPGDTTISWHAGQLYAFANDYRSAISRMEHSFDKNDRQWSEYVQLTILFLQNNKQEFVQLYSSLGDNFNKAVIDRLYQGFGKPYSKVY